MNDFPADRSGCFFTATFPGSVWSIDVVKPSDARCESIILTKMSAHAFRKELLPPVAIFCHSRIGITLFKRCYVAVSLFVGVVNASTARIEESFNVGLVGLL